MAVPYTKKELFDTGSQQTYRGRNLDEIAFPLGGIGTGSISLGGWGQLRDWEIMNRPAKGYTVPQSFFTLKVRSEDGKAETRILQGPAGGSFTASGHRGMAGFGVGLPHFREVAFQGSFPFARVMLKDAEAPVEVTLEAFNPFIPLNDRDSSIPCAILLYHIANRSTKALDATLFGNLANVIGGREPEGHYSASRSEERLSGLYMTTRRWNADSPKHGSMVLAMSGENVRVWPRWKDSSIAKFWEMVAWRDEFPPAEEGSQNTGTVAASFRIEAGEAATVPVLICWYFPVFELYWDKTKDQSEFDTWRNYYATQWEGAWDVAKYVAENLWRLEEQTRCFHDTLFASTLPSYVLDAISSQISILNTNTCIRLTDGTFYGFEGCDDAKGCCVGTCTHVWNYAQALPYLFPGLQRSVREAEWKNSMKEDGFVQFRVPLPLGTKPDALYHPAADGQMGTVIQLYREWLISGDRKWLEGLWPFAKRALEFAWKYWDADRDGVMEGMQHNTYDIEFYGPNTMMGSLYLGALRAAEEMGRELGEEKKAKEYRELFERGSVWTDENLFNGEYYEQKVEPEAYKNWPERYRESAKRRGNDDRYDWPKWQYGKGCISDQLIGQWYGAMLGLGYFYNKEKVTRALESVFKHNWRSDLSNHPGLLRIYALNDEAGLLIGTWPRGERPGYGFYFADEVWCGIEYQVASHLIYEGFLDEGLAIVLGARKRYRGDRRNPWNEIECGHHYSRSMSSYALLLALSGFSYSAAEARIGFAPRIFEQDFRSFFSVGSGWGLFSQKRNGQEWELSLDIRFGSLTLKELSTGIAQAVGARATIGDEEVAVGFKEGRLIFSAPVMITPEEGLVLKLI
jgi:uncharacterized protein (DUF608 family)